MFSGTNTQQQLSISEEHNSTGSNKNSTGISNDYSTLTSIASSSVYLIKKKLAAALSTGTSYFNQDTIETVDYIDGELVAII